MKESKDRKGREGKGQDRTEVKGETKGKERKGKRGCPRAPWGPSPSDAPSPSSRSRPAERRGTEGGGWDPSILHLAPGGPRLTCVGSCLSHLCLYRFGINICARLYACCDSCTFDFPVGFNLRREVRCSRLCTGMGKRR